MGTGLTLGSIVTRVGADIKPLAAGLTKAESMSKASAARMDAMFSKAAVGIGAAMAGIGTIAAKKFLEFEQGLANVATLIPKASARMKQLSADVKDLAKVSGKDTTDLLGGLYQTVSAFGDDASKTTKRLEIAVRAATAGMATTTDAVNLLSAVTKGYGDTSLEATQKAADLAFLTVKMGQTTFPELAASIGRVIPPAAKMGVTVEEVNAAFATLTGVTGNTAEVSTQLAGVMRAFIKPTEDMKKAITSLGFDGAEAIISEKGLKGALDALVGTTDRSVEAVGKLFRRAEAMNALFALTGESADKYTQSLRANSDATGTLAEAHEEVANTAQFKLNKALQDLNVSLIEMGQNLSPVIDKLSGLISAIAKLVGVVGIGIEGFDFLFGAPGRNLKQAEELTKRIEAQQKAAAAERREFEALVPVMQALIGRGKSFSEIIAEVPEHLKKVKKTSKEISDIFKDFTVGGALQFLITGGAKAPDRTPTKEIKNSITELKKAYQDLLKNIDADTQASGDRNRVLRIYNEELQDMLQQYKAWGIELPPILKALDEQNKKQAEFKRKVDETVKSLEKRLELEQQIRNLPITGKVDTDIVDAVQDAPDAINDATRAIIEARRETDKWTSEFVTMGEIIQNLAGGQGSILGQMITFIGVSFKQMADDMKGEIATLGKWWKQHWREVTAMGLSALGQIVGGRAGSALGGAGAGFGLGASVGSVVPGLGTLTGGILGGAIGFVGGLFGGGGGDERRRQRMEEMRRKREEENNKLLAEFIDMLDGLIEAETIAIQFTGDFNDMLNQLKVRNVDLSQALTTVDSAIADTTRDIEDMERQLATLPDHIRDLAISVDQLHRSMRDARIAAHHTRQEMMRLAEGPDRFAEAQAELKAANAELAAALKSEDEKRIAAARQRVRLAEAELDAARGRKAGLKFRQFLPNLTGGGGTFGAELEGQEAMAAILDALARAKDVESQRGRRITIQEEREILKGAGNAQTKILIKQLIQQENAVFEAKRRFEEMRQTRIAAKETERSLEHNLPLMRERLKTLEDVKKEIQKGFGRQHIDFKNLTDAILNRRETGNPGKRVETSLASVHNNSIRPSSRFTGSSPNPNLNSSIGTQNNEDGPLNIRLTRAQPIVINLGGHEVKTFIVDTVDEANIDRGSRTLRARRRY